MTETVAAVMMVAGSLLSLIAAIGLIRFQDVYSRMQATSKPATLGILLTLAGAAVTVANPTAVAKLTLVIILMFLTAPIGAHLVGRAVYRAGAALQLESGIDELARDLAEAQEQ